MCVSIQSFTSLSTQAIRPLGWGDKRIRRGNLPATSNLVIWVRLSEVRRWTSFILNKRSVCDIATTSDQETLRNAPWTHVHVDYNYVVSGSINDKIWSSIFTIASAISRRYL